MPIFYFQGYIYFEKLNKLSNPQCSFPPGYHHGLCSVQPKQVTQAAIVVPIYLALITFDIHDGTSICLPSTYRGSIDVFW